MSDTTNDGTLTEVLARLKRLEDIDAIGKLCLQYRQHLDERDFAAYSTLFVEDGVWIGNLGSATGPAEIEALLERTLERHTTPERHLHLVANPVIEVDGDTGTAQTTWVYLTRDFRDNPVLSLIGHYEDKLVRTDAGWRFQRREAYLDFPYEEQDFRE
ncbi:MAG: nuclear transport factor 2 family protein [Gaiellales bacterium]